MLLFPITSYIYAYTNGDNDDKDETDKVHVVYPDIEKKIRKIMEDGKIPGLSLVIINKDDPLYIKGFGYADKKKGKPVTSDSLFELGSCTKAFTALAVVQLEENGLIHLDDPASKYFPDFFVRYKGQHYQVTIRQLLHQTSGIPWKAISLIPMGNQEDALVQTVKNLKGIELNQIPGEQFQYSTINYALLGAIIEKASGMSFDQYMVKIFSARWIWIIPGSGWIKSIHRKP